MNIIRISLFFPLWLFLLIFACDNPDQQKQLAAQQRTLVHKLQGASQLATVEYVLNKVVMGNKTNTFFGIWVGESDFLAETEVRVKAGIDLQKIRPEDVRIVGSEIFINLPPVEILNLSYPSEKFKINEEFTRDEWFSELSTEEIDHFFQQADIAVRKDIQWLGVEESAREKTQHFLERFLYQAGYEAVHISFNTPQIEPSSKLPQP